MHWCLLAIARLSPALFLPMVLIITTPLPVIAQPQSANDGTNTRVTRSGDRFDITGGMRSGDRANLFHSFEQFGLDASQVANFLSDPEIRNILGRVVGGEASFIDGLIQVTGSEANLYLINPAGLIFGPNARLNVPGDFTATTADGVGFGQTWFAALGENDYASLVGNPDGYRFTALTPGSLVNAGDLGVSEGASLTLLGGTVVNTGTLTAPGGTLTVAAVPGESYVRIQQTGMLLSLEIEPLSTANAPASVLPFTPLQLPELLTGQALTSATDVQVNADGTVRLSGSGLTAPTDSGTALIGGTLSTAASTIAPEIAPEINVLGTQVALLNAHLDASGRPGGTIRIGGDYQGQGTVPNAVMTYVDGETTLTADGLASVDSPDDGTGDGGRIIVWADNTTQFYGTLTARGQGSAGDGGFAEVSGREGLVFAGTADLTATDGRTGTLLLDPENITIVDGDGGANDDEIEDDGEIFSSDGPGENFTISAVALETASTTADVFLTANDNITLADLSDDTLSLSGSINLTADADNDGVGTFSMEANDTIQIDNTTTEFENVTLSGATVIVGNIVISDRDGVNLIGDEIDFIGGENSIQIGETASSQDTIFNSVNIQPRTDGVAIAIGSTTDTPGVLDLSDADLAAIEPNDDDFFDGEDGFNAVNISSSDGTGDITFVGGPTPLVVDYELDLQTETGTITLEPRPIVADGLELQADTIDIRSAPASVQVEALTITNGTPGNRIVVDETATGEPDTLAITAAELQAFAFVDEGLFAGTSIQLGDETGQIDINTPLPPVNSVRIAADEINLNAGAGTVTASFLTLTTGSDGQPTLVGGETDTGALDITQQDLEAIALSDSGRLSIGAGFRPFENGDVTILAADSPLPLEPMPSSLALNAGNGTITIQNRPIQVEDLSLTADEIELLGDRQSIQLEQLTVSTSSAEQDITVGGTADSGGTTLDLTALELETFSFPPRTEPSFTTITINAQDGDTVLSVQTPLPEVDEVTLRANEINLLAGTGTLRAGQVELIPTSGITTRLGDLSDIDTGVDTLDLTTTDLAAVQLVGSSPSIRFGAGNRGLAGDVIVVAGSTPLDFAGDLTLDAGTGTVTVEDRLVRANQINFQANEVELLGAANSIQGTGIVVAPGGPGQRLTLGAIDSTDAGAVELTANELATLRGSETGIEISRVSAFGVDEFVAVEIATSDEPLTLGSSLNVNFGAESVTLDRELVVNGTLTLAVADDPDTDTPSSLIITRNLAATNTLEFSGVDSLQIQGDVTFDVRTLNLAQNVTGTDGTSVFRVNARGSVSLADVTANGGIFLTSDNRRIETGNLNSSGAAGGEIQVSALRAVTTGNVNSSGSDGNGGAILLSSAEAGVTAGSLTSSGNIGGEIQVLASTEITTAGIDSSGSIGDGGNVTLDPSGDIEVGFIDARGGPQGLGGTVDITTESFFRATDTFAPRVSISSVGGAGNGDITIRHGGGTETAFIVGDGDTNGTAAAILSGEVSLQPPQEFFGSFELDNLAILTEGEVDGETPVVFDPTVFEDPVAELPIANQNTTLRLLDVYGVEVIETFFSSQYADYLGLPPWEALSLADIQERLRQIERQTGVRPAVIYAVFLPTSASLPSEQAPGTSETPSEEDHGAKSQVETAIAPSLPIPDAIPGQELWRSPLLNGPGLNLDLWFERQALRPESWRPQDDDQLELLMVTGEGDVVRQVVPGATREKVTELAIAHRQATTRWFDGTTRYLSPAQQLYQRLIAPLAADLAARQVDNLVFSLDAGLRATPLASLHDGDQFLIERYSVGLVPSLSLTETRYVNLQDASVLAMGASEFEALAPLPGVPVELSLITEQLWSGVAFLNESFTLDALKEEQEMGGYRIVHLATHAEFASGEPENSYIQLWDQPLRLTAFREMGWHRDPGVSLAVLSACQTAIGSDEAELGFAGFAVQAGAQSVLASLWSVNDVGTLMLMAEFYQNLQSFPIRAEALQQAQIALMDGTARIENGQLVWSGGQLPAPASLQLPNRADFTHPAFWAGFTMVGSPW